MEVLLHGWKKTGPNEFAKKSSLFEGFPTNPCLVSVLEWDALASTASIMIYLNVYPLSPWIFAVISSNRGRFLTKISFFRHQSVT